MLTGLSNCTIKLITQIGAAPACACGSSCTGNIDNAYGLGYVETKPGCGCGSNLNFLGSVTEIPIDKIASFVHNAI